MNAAEVCNTNCNKVKVSNSGDSNSISEADVDVVQSPNDKRKYKVVVLDNGLRVLLISDLNSDPESSSECEKPCQDEQKNEDISESETDETADDVSDMEQDAIPSDGGKQECVEDGEKLAAAALCVGVGSFSDPPDIPGLAHFLEHMVFMGSEKYPDENAFDSFVRKHGGNNNACTDCERTTFCFDIERKHLKDALDIFAQFFISPLLKENSVDREINAVDSEFDMSKTSNSVIKQQLFGSLGKKGIPMGKFMWGNIESLKETPSTKGIDLYENLQIFHRHYYSAHFMTLCVQAKAPLDLMQSWVTEIFSDIPNNKTTQPSFYHVSDSFNTPDFTKLYQVVPVKNTNQLSLTWHMPCLRHLYRCKPLHYVGWLCGHEGSGSILSYLKKKSWALTVVAGNAESGWEHNSTGALFEVNITLTDEGLRNYEGVIKVVFEYLTLLREVGASVQIYNQIKLVEDNDFRWKEKVDPWDYAEHLAEAMQLYEPVDYLRGSTVLYDWTDECKFSIESVIHKLLPSNCNIMVLSPSFEAQADREEYWYKTKYLVKEVPQSLRDPTAFRPRRQLHLPPPNDFIASDFSLKDPNTLYTKEPKLILNTSRSKLWYKQDRKFKVPKVCVYFHILSPVVSTSAKSQALLDLFLDILSHNLVEVAYNAYVAQLEYEFKATNEGIIIKLRGFSHKLHKLMEIIMDRIDEFDVSDQDFHTLNEQLKKNYFNSFIKPEKLARDVRLMLLENKSWTKVHKRAFLANLRKVDLMNFVSEFKRMSHIEGYVHGNYTVEEALNMESCVRNRLRNDALPQAMLPVERVTQLPVDDSVVRVKSFHEGDTNSTVMNYFQVGPADISKFVTLELLNSIMEEPCFDILRTKEQLGYSVFSDMKNTSGIIGLTVTVSTQASKFSVKLVDEKIEEFLLEMADRLDDMAAKEFNTHRDSLIAVKRCDDSSLQEAADRLFTEIRDKTYLFDRLDKEVEELEKLDLEEVVSLFHSTLGTAEANLRKKLSVQVVGFGEKETGVPVKAETFSAFSQSTPVDLSLCQGLATDCTVKSSPSSESSNSSDTPVTAPLATTVPLTATEDTELYDFTHLEIDPAAEGCRSFLTVDDLHKFKCGLSLHPVSKIL